MIAQDALVHVPLRMRVLSPVHIGTGDSLNAKSFVSADGQVYVADDQKLLELIIRTPRAQSDFEQFCLGNDPLSKFLSDHGLKAGEVASYSLRRAGARLGRNLLLFIKTPNIPPRPYLPGSSIKGAVRSALLRGHLLKRPQAKSRAENHVRQKFGDGKAKQADDILDQRFFGTTQERDWQHYDWMRLLQFTDTPPVDASCLEVAEVHIFSATADHELVAKKKASGEPVVLSPEVLKPQTVLHGALTINRNLASPLAEPELAFGQRLSRVLDFASTCNLVAEEQIEQEIAFYDHCNRRDLIEWYERMKETLHRLSPDECLLRIGWGTGYDTKTVSDVFNDQMFDDIRKTYDLPVGQPGRRGQLLPKRLSPKSRKLAVYRGKDKQEEVWPMGWIWIKAQ